MALAAELCLGEVSAPLVTPPPDLAPPGREEPDWLLFTVAPKPYPYPYPQTPPLPPDPTRTPTPKPHSYPTQESLLFIDDNPAECAAVRYLVITPPPPRAIRYLAVTPHCCADTLPFLVISYRRAYVT